MQMTPEYRESIEQPASFWRRQAERLHWHTPAARILDASELHRARWFVGGKTNLCYNAVDRHLDKRGDQLALVHIDNTLSTSIDAPGYTYRELHAEVSAMAAVLQTLGVQAGDRVLLCLPVMPETVFCMLACTRIGAIHCVVFGGFPAEALAHRLDDVTPRVVITVGETGANGRTSDSPLLTEALAHASHRPAHVIQLQHDRRRRGDTPGEAVIDFSPLPDIYHDDRLQRHDYDVLRAAMWGCQVDCVWLDSETPSYILHTSGTSGKPKGVVRDTGGYAVALLASLDYQFGLHAGDTLFATSDLGWVVGHSYGVYAPLLGGLTTVLHVGSLSTPDADLIWRIVQRYRVNALLSAPVVMRLVMRGARRLHGRASQRSGYVGRAFDLSTLNAVFLAGEPMDELLSSTVSMALDKPVIDHYWQTETGSPIVAGDLRSKEPERGYAVNGFKLGIVDPEIGAMCGTGQRGVLLLEAPLPPGCLRGLWGDSADDLAFKKHYWMHFPPNPWYSTADWARRDEDGGIRLLGRADDTINVAGQRIGTREIEAVLRRDSMVADVVVLGLDDPLRGQIPVAFVVPGQEHLGVDIDMPEWQARLSALVVQALGAAARPRRIFMVRDFPRTRSGKVMRRMIAKVFEGERCDVLQIVGDASEFLPLIA